jgi:hypothetical protein
MAALWSLLVPTAVARAQPAPPKFDFARPDVPAEGGPPAVEKKLQAKGGLLLMGGNSRLTTGTLGAQGSYRRGWNRLGAETNAAYARSEVLGALDANQSGLIDSGELVRTKQTTSKLFSAKARYDRLFTVSDSAYASGQALTDEPAGKELVAGGQVGYSRQLYKDDRHLAVAEVGYDFSFERAAAPGASGVNVHSARAFLSEQLKLSEASGLFASAELLTNLNEESAPAPGFQAVPAFEDTRVVAKTGLTTSLWNRLAFSFSLGLRYDQSPAPLKVPGSLPLAPGFAPLPRAEELDTVAEASLVVTFM